MPAEPDKINERARAILNESFDLRLRDPENPAQCFLSAFYRHCGHAEMRGVAGPADGDPPMSEFELWVVLRGTRDLRPVTVPRAPIDPLSKTAAVDFIRLVRSLTGHKHGAWMLGGQRELVNTVTIVDTKVTTTSVYFKLRVT